MGTEFVGQAIYDDPALFSAYEEMRREDGRLNELVETPALISLMPDLTGAVVADFGCGAGSMCRWLADQGAVQVLGFDASERMLARAKSHQDSSEKIRYERRAIERIELASNSIDVIVSGLALHYVEEFVNVAHRVRRALVAGGSFIFSVEHPVVTCGTRQWVDTAERARAYWPVERYLEPGPRSVKWLGLDEVPRYHRTVSGYVNALLDAGLSLRRLLEPGPDAQAIAAWPRMVDQVRRPAFLVIRADKPS